MSTESKPKLLILGPRARQIGGVETVTEAILNSGAFAEFEVRHFDTTKGRPKHTQAKVDLGNLVWGAIFVSRMIFWMIRFRPDVVYMPLAGRWAAFLRDSTLAVIARVCGAIVVGHVHSGSIIPTLEYRGFRRRLVRFGLSNFSSLLVLGRNVLSAFREYGYKGELSVAPSTMTPEFFARGVAYKRQSIDRTFLQALFVGQVGRNKGVSELLRAMSEVKRLGRPVMLDIVGPEELTGEMMRLRHEASSLELHNFVRFCGPMNSDALASYYEQADLLVLPSYKEMLPVVLLEAGLYELPVITTPVGAIPDLIRHDVNGLFVQPGDSAGIVSALQELSSADSRARLGSQLRRDVLGYSPDFVCARIAGAVRGVTYTRSQRVNRVFSLLRNVAWPPLIIAAECVRLFGSLH